MRSSLLVLALAAACNQPDTEAAVAAPAPPAPPKPDPVVKGIPHGGHISKVAVTEQADAALTFDNVGGVRLWPSLDATRTPVPIAVVAPNQLGIAHAGRDLLATILDDAGSVRIMRLGRDGSVRGDVQLRSEVAYKQVIALDEGVMVLGDDQRIEWFSPDGQSRGRLVAEPAKRIQSITARRGRAVAIITDGNRAELRWLLMMGGALTWGAGIDLPLTPKDALVAMSPTQRRIALVDQKSQLTVFELGLVPTQIGTPVFASSPSDIGFIDEDRVAIMGSSMSWWINTNKKPGSDPWVLAAPTMPTPSSMLSAEGGAVADGMAVMGFGAALSLVDKDAVHYLGYREHGVGNVIAEPSSLSVTMTGSHIVWLDDTLAIKRQTELRKDPLGPWLYATPVGDHHVVTQVPFEGKYKVQLIDLDNESTPTTLGTYQNVERIEYSPDSGLLGVGVYTQIHRFELDLAKTAATELKPVKVRGSLVSLRLLDPEKSGGITAITVGWAHDYDEDYTLTIYRDKGKSKRIHPFVGRVLDIDETGKLYALSGAKLEVRDGDKKPQTLELDRMGSVVAMKRDGSRFATVVDNDVVVLDGNGDELWHKPLWGTQQLVFTMDGKYLAARASGGLLLLDAVTGERKAMECGWSFSLMTTPPPTNALASAPVCEDPML